MTYEANLEQLNDFLAKLETELSERMIPLKIVMSILIAAEEIFVNIASYAYQDKKGTMEVDLDITNDCVRLTFMDEGIPFDPLAKADPDITASAEERGIGGLGIYMVKQSMDRVTYEYRDNRNVLTFWKNY